MGDYDMSDSLDKKNIKVDTIENEAVSGTNEVTNHAYKKIQNNSTNTSFTASEMTERADSPKEKTRNYNCFISWLISTCLISIIPSITYIICFLILKNSNFDSKVYLHEIAFFSIVLLSNMICTVYFGSGRRKYKQLYVIGGIATIMEVVSFIIFTLIIASEVVKTLSFSGNMTLVSVVICVASLVLGGIAEFMEDLVK